MATKQEGVDPAPPVAEAAQPDLDVQRLWDALEVFDIPRKKVFELLAPHSEKIWKSLETFDIPRQALWEQYKDVGKLFADDFKRNPIQAMKDWEIRRVDPSRAGQGALETFDRPRQALEEYWTEREGELEKK